MRFLKGQPISGRTTYAFARAIAVSPNGSEVFVTGERGEKAGGLFGTVAYGAATGTRLWLASYGGTSGSPAAMGMTAKWVAAGGRLLAMCARAEGVLR